MVDELLSNMRHQSPLTSSLNQSQGSAGDLAAHAGREVDGSLDAGGDLRRDHAPHRESRAP